MKHHTRTLVATVMLAAALGGPALAQNAAQPAVHGKVMAITQTHSVDRPDTWITSTLKSKLASSSDLAATHILVDVTNGTVWLQGTVKDPAQIQAATDLALQTTGVKSVNATALVVEGGAPAP